MDAEKEALEGRDPDKKSKVFLLILLFAPSLLLLGVFAIILIISINSFFSPQNKANNFLNVNVSSDFSNENNVENLFNSILNLDSNSLKGNYYNSNAIESTEFMFYRQLYESKNFPITCFNKEKATAMIIATLFYNGDFNSSLNYNDQDYLLHNSKYDPKKGSENSSNNFENRLEELMSFFNDDSEVATKETKKLYKYACKGYESYQQYLVDTYIPNNASDFSLNVPNNGASKSEQEEYENLIATIGEEIVFSADNYLRLNGSYLIDHEKYKIKMPNFNNNNNVIYGNVGDGIDGTTIFWGEYTPKVGYNDRSYYNWKQRDSRWANLALSNFKTREDYNGYISKYGAGSVSQGMVGPYGCYATSIAIAIKMMDENGFSNLNRGYLDRYYNGNFDPGVLVSEVGKNKGFSMTSDLNYQVWDNISSVKIMGDIYYSCNPWNYINQSEFQDIANEVENGKPVILHLNNPHFVTVTGVIRDGNGKIIDLIISDPGTSSSSKFSQNSYCSRLVGYRKVY